ncbi:ROK family protein [Catenulispora rubra]|uniref:ROK family protein n=1 Tax=Catenulispora rubra TaxID=280293 RepID=UPI001E6124C1|nr:ROK family protein [Catenulispora rubra]
MDRRQTGTNLAGLRDHNTALVLRLLRADAGAAAAGEGSESGSGAGIGSGGGAGTGSSRVQLAAETGLTPQAISKITARLLDEGLIVETGRAESTGGKPRTLLAVRPEAAYTIGVELDRRHSTILLVDLAGQRRRRESLMFGLASGTPERVAAGLAERVQDLIRTAPGGGRVLGVGIGCRGPLDYETGMLHRPAGLPGWDGYPLCDVITALLDLPTAASTTVLLDKDTNTAALAAPAPGPGNTAYLHLADGLGAGLQLNGAIYRGTRTNAGEFGHQVVQAYGPVCTCGSRGCLEALCLAALADGDPHTAARWLGLGAANLVRLLDIDRILLGGHQIFAAPEVYLSAVAEQIAEHLPDPAWQDVQVSLTPAGADAVAVGAARLALDTALEAPVS